VDLDILGVGVRTGVGVGVVGGVGVGVGVDVDVGGLHSSALQINISNRKEE